MNLIWRNSPFLRILIAFVVGIFFFETVYHWYLLLALCLCLIIIQLRKKQIQVVSLLFMIMWMLAGSTFVNIQNKEIQTKEYCGILHPIQRIGKQKKWLATFSFEQAHQVQTIQCLASLDLDAPCQSYHCKGEIQTLRKGPWPMDPNYHYLIQKRIFYQLDTHALQPLENAPIPSNDEPSWLSNTRQYLDSSEYALVMALLIGKTNELHHEIKAEYRVLGISHLLAVSGMHVGLIYWILQRILSILFFRKMKSTQAIIIIVFLWWYCTICQFAPSIIRACYMFTILQIGELGRRKTSPFNLLAFSAFSILLITPAALYDWGFILSHLAVLGLLIFQKTTQQKFNHLTSWKKQFFQILSSSLQAQWITSPFTLLYNAVFPTYFLLANLILIPYSTLLLYASILCVTLLQFQSWPLMIEAWKYLIDGMNGIVHILNLLPYKQWTIKHFCWIEAISIYLVGFLVYQYFRSKTFPLLFYSICVLNLLWFHHNIHYAFHKTEIHFFKHHHQCCMVYTNGLYQWQYPAALPENYIPKEFGELLNP